VTIAKTLAIGAEAGPAGNRPGRRAAMVAHSFYPSDVRIRREAVALHEAGWEVDVICLRGPGEAASALEDGIAVIRVPLGRRRGSRLRYLAEYGLAFGALAWSLDAAMRRRRYSVVQVHTLPDFLLFAALPARWRGARLLLDMHEIAPEFYQQKYGVPASRLAVRALAAVEQRAMRAADAVITVTDALRERFVSRGAPAQRISVVMNAADEKLFPAGSGASASGRSVEKPLGLVYHGSLLPYYGVDVLLQAIGRVRSRWPFELDVYGGGEAGEALGAAARDGGLGEAVRFHGTVAQTGLAAVLQRAGGGVVPTRGGPMLDLSLSNKLLEMACIGMPIVASALATYRRHLPDDCVVYAPPGDPDALAAALDRFAAMSAAERSALARRAAARYREFSWDRQREVYLGVVERLAANDPDSRPSGRSPRDE